MPPFVYDIVDKDHYDDNNDNNDNNDFRYIQPTVHLPNHITYGEYTLYTIIMIGFFIMIPFLSPLKLLVIYIYSNYVIQDMFGLISIIFVMIMILCAEIIVR